MAFCYCKEVDAAPTLDLQTPRNEILSAFYKRSFAYHTVKERMPIILTQVIDGLVRDKQEIAREFGEEAVEELKTIIGLIAKLKYEIQTNKQMVPIVVQDADVHHYNDFLKVQRDLNCSPKYFNAKWLFVECYMYRRLQECFEMTTLLNNYDPFRKQKQEAFEAAQPLIEVLGTHSLALLDREITDPEELRNEFGLLLKLDLWGNKCDLSLSNGKAVDLAGDMVTGVRELDKYILVDDTDQIWLAAVADNRFQIIDIICDNSGYEILTDLCLADFMVTYKLAETVRFYVKTIPWFISDVTESDFSWVLEQLVASDHPILAKLGERWTTYVGAGVWKIENYDYWTTPLEFKLMRATDEYLYNHLARAKLAIFKGDLNYRKLFGERKWEPTTSVSTALEGFHPTKLCTLRTLKSDIVVGLKEGDEDRLDSAAKDWMLTGSYGVIQFCGKVVKTYL